VVVAEGALELPLRFYRVGRLYGPGMPRPGPEGFQEKILRRSLENVGIVSVHCWNLGEADGPYPIAPGTRCPGAPADWVPAAHRIVAEGIAPVLAAGREAGVAVFHVAQAGYARKYPQYVAISEDPELQSPEQPVQAPGCPRPRSRDEKWGDQYGADFPGPVWETHRDSFDIARAARPLGDEPVVLTGWQLNGLCRRRDIDTLFYVGFMADLCLMNVPGAIREMSSRFGYRCVVLRDGTTAYEYPDTSDDRSMTRAAIRLVETDLGYSSTCGALIEALEGAR